MSSPSPSARPSSTTALFIDGSALFFAQRAVSPDKNLDYNELQSTIARHRSTPWPPKPAIFFTAGDDANDKQKKFHDMLHEQFHWTIRQVPPPEANIVNPLLSDQTARIIRFDALMAYSLARLAGRPEISRIIVISDSWPLCAPVKDCVSRGTPVTICFFGEVIDTRWHKVFRDADPNQLDFLDLDNMPKLFNRPRIARRREDEVLNDLP